jgi:hypothetical protein
MCLFCFHLLKTIVFPVKLAEPNNKVSPEPDPLHSVYVV